MKSTTEISVENCSRMISSSSSISTKSIAITSSIDQLNEIKCIDGTNGNGTNTNGIFNGQIEESEPQTSVERQHVEIVDINGSGGRVDCDDGDGSCSMVTKKSSSKLSIASKLVTKSGDSKSSPNTPDSIKACDLLSQFSMTPTSKNPPTEVTMQRPLKPVSEMDFSVPYNIINNYFSVGVVSNLAFLIYFHSRVQLFSVCAQLAYTMSNGLGAISIVF